MGLSPLGWAIGGVAASLALGAAAAGSTPYYYGGYPGGCYFTRQPVVNSYGNVIGYHRVRYCY